MVNSNNLFTDERLRFENALLSKFHETVQALSRMYTELTAAELDVAALTKLGFDAKRTAPILEKNFGTINNIRSSIRKKIGVPANVSLRQFLYSQPAENREMR